ncbi:hypothetical protein B0T20DRAFT_269073 [Sordaria brevicollis]|uniref:Uncharacterized protein n=1 Tax=Sordaria brevicollis TaxID=83679 RepID=A0AAE0PAP6_SORBR|nr:hypothetical protein B0T20DRAFT_269073 [Sordaria brevicollis]
MMYSIRKVPSPISNVLCLSSTAFHLHGNTVRKQLIPSRNCYRRFSSVAVAIRVPLRDQPMPLSRCSLCSGAFLVPPPDLYQALSCSAKHWLCTTPRILLPIFQSAATCSRFSRLACSAMSRVTSRCHHELLSSYACVLVNPQDKTHKLWKELERNLDTP